MDCQATTLEEAIACVQEYLDKVLNYSDPANGITKFGFITDEHVQELKEAGLEIEGYDQDYLTLWIEGHPITVEAMYYETGMNIFDVTWEIAN